MELRAVRPAVALLLAAAAGTAAPPNLTGLPLDSARTVARAAGFRVEEMRSRDEVHRDFVDAASFGENTARLNWKYRVHQLPGVVGMTMAGAESALVAAGYALGPTRGASWEELERRRQLRIVPHGFTSGIIVRQEPAPGRVRGLPPLHLTFGRLPAAPDEPVAPARRLTGLPLDSALVLLGDSGPAVRVDTVTGTGHRDIVLAAGYRDDTLRLRWAAGTSDLPDLRGRTPAGARQALAGAGFDPEPDPAAAWPDVEQDGAVRLVLHGDSTRPVVMQRPGPGRVTGLPKLELWFGERAAAGWFWPWGALGLAAVLIVVLVVVRIVQTQRGRPHELPPVELRRPGSTSPEDEPVDAPPDEDQ